MQKLRTTSSTALVMSSFGSRLNCCLVITRCMLLCPFLKPFGSEHSDRSDMLRLCRPLKPPSILLFYTNRKLSVLNINKHTKFILCSKYKNNVQPFKTIKHSDSVNLWNVFHHSRLSVIFTPLHTCSVTYINTVFPQYIVSAGHHCNVIESEIHSCVQKTP